MHLVLYFTRYFQHSDPDESLNNISRINRMTLEDFCKFYSDLDICCLCPDFLDGDAACHWKTSYYEGRWVAGTTAGGCMNDLGTSKISGLSAKLSPKTRYEDLECHF